MQDLLATYYDIHVNERVKLGPRDGFRVDEYLYFTIPANNREVIHMEQAALAYFLVEHNFSHVVIPIPNVHGEWFTRYDEESFAVLQVKKVQQDIPPSQGKSLATFHQICADYRYEPQEISSYGQWKELWIDKLTAFENKIISESEANPCEYYRLLMDSLPYLIGISENAIQYMQETEQEYRFDEVDKGTITFRRYTGNIINPVIWFDELVYDHPTRDIAEYIRYMFLQNDHRAYNEVVAFLQDYQSVRSLSVFSWRLVYARLIFPIHLFDLIEKGFSEDADFGRLSRELKDQLDHQEMYEKRLGSFFQVFGVDHQALQIPVLHWL